MRGYQIKSNILEDLKDEISNINERLLNDLKDKNKFFCKLRRC